MRSLVRVLVCALCLGSSAAIAQVVVGATAEPAETSIGNAVEISIDFQTNQNANANANWRCGLNVDYGDGKSELHRVDSKQLPFKAFGEPTLRKWQACESDNDARRRLRLEVPRQQSVQVFGLGRRQGGEHMFKVSVGFHTV